MNNLVVIPKKTETAIEQIESSWNKTLEFVLQTSKLINSYMKRDDWVDIKRELISRGIMKDSVISMMISIGRNNLLQSKKNRDILPKAYNTLYHLSRLENGDLSSHLTKGEITPSLTLEQAKDYRNPSTAKPNSKKENKEIVRISVKNADYKKYKSEISNLLSEIAKKYPYLILSKKK